MSGVIVLALRLILAICLYAFLGWALFSLWRDLQTQGVRLAVRKAPPLNLTIQSPGAETSQRAFHQSDISIGRDPACDVCIADAALSRRHALVLGRGGRAWLRHLSRTNATYVNGRFVRAEVELHAGDELCLPVALLRVVPLSETEE